MARQNVRPERPDNEDAPHLSDAVWELAERCWVKNPKERPTAKIVCDRITDLLSATVLLPNQSPPSAPSRSGDIVQQCLALTPVPHLAPAFSTFSIIWYSIEQVQASKKQLEVLVLSIAQLLQTLNKEYSASQLLEANTLTLLDDFFRFVSLCSSISTHTHPTFIA